MAIMNATELFDALVREKQQRGEAVNFTQTDVTNEYNALDIAAIQNSSNARITVSEWDGSPVSGVDMLNHPNPVIKSQIQETWCWRKGIFDLHRWKFSIFPIPCTI